MTGIFFERNHIIYLIPASSFLERGSESPLEQLSNNNFSQSANVLSQYFFPLIQDY